MGQQSSRIIWGKTKNTGGNEPGPVEIYKPDTYIYCSGNYAIHSDGIGRVAEDYHLYLCTATETGGSWNPEDWKIVNGVKNYYLIAHRSFKKGAKVIKEDYNGDFETLKLYECIVDKTTPNRWIDDEWEVVYQDVGIAWIPRDHKAVYYDDGKNRNKWHKLMWFVPDYYDDQKSDEEIGMFSELRTYHYGERAIHISLLGEVFCYTYDSEIPRKTEWAAGWWSKDENVGLYETFKTYYKGDEVIKKNIEAGYQDIQQYQNGMYFEQGKYTLQIIDKEHDVHELAGFHDINYIERIISGESLYGLYKSITTTSGEFEQDAWVLQASSIVQTRGRDHNPDQKDIKVYEYCKGYTVGELCIWTFEDDTNVFGLLECIKTIPETTTGEFVQDFMPPNSEYWRPVSQFVEQADTLRVFKATKAMDASINDHFIRENWAIVSQKMEPDYDLYGVIWEKYGSPGGGGGIPFGFPIVLNGKKYGDQSNILRSRLSVLYPFLGNSCLEIEKDFSSNDGMTTPCSGGQAFLTTIAYKLYSGDAEVTKFMKYDLTGFHELSMTDFVNVFRYSFIENGLIYYDQKGTRASRCFYGTIYKSYFGTDTVFGKVPIVDIPRTYDISEGYSLFYTDSHWNDEDYCSIFMHGGDGVMTLVKHQTYGGISNIITSDSRMEGTTFNQCWETVLLDKRIFCCIKDDGTLEEFGYFNDYITVSQALDNGITQINIDDDGTNYEPYSGKMDYGITPDKYFPAATNYTVGSENIGVCKESPWFDTDWLSFPNLEEVEAYIGNGVLVHNEQDNVVLNHLRLFCNQYGLTLHQGDDEYYWSAKGHSYHITDEASGYYGYPIIKKEGYAYRDRYGNIYVICHKIMRISSYDYDLNKMKYKEYHQWGFVRGDNFSVFYSYFNDYYENAPDSEKYKYRLHLIGRDDDYILAAIEGPGGATRHKINLKSGAMSVSTFPMYYDLPYVGNTTFRVNGNEYSKVRVFLGINWEYYGVELPEAGDDTYVLGTIPVNTYWTPYIANIGGVCHTGDLMQIYSNWDSYWAIYVPNPLTNPIGAGGFVFGTGDYDSLYKPDPSYGGPADNGFINK